MANEDVDMAQSDPITCGEKCVHQPCDGSCAISYHPNLGGGSDDHPQYHQCSICTKHWIR